ncbi:hypothetical protein Droror1_Dr00015126, partial [Drosera rotundifolia]
HHPILKISKCRREVEEEELLECCCVNNPFCLQVAERALFLWNNVQILNLIRHNRQMILPIIFPALERNAEGHWNQSVLNLTLNITKLLHEMDDDLLQACQAQFREDQANLSSMAEKRNATWERLENAARLQPTAAENVAVLVTPNAMPVPC